MLWSSLWSLVHDHRALRQRSARGHDHIHVLRLHQAQEHEARPPGSFSMVSVRTTARRGRSRSLAWRWRSCLEARSSAPIRKPRICAALDGRLFFAMIRGRKLCAAREARAQKPCAWLRRWRSRLSRSGLLESQALVQPLISMAHDAGARAHQCAGLPGAGARARRPGNGARRAQAVTSRRSRSRSSHVMPCS